MSTDDDCEATNAMPASVKYDMEELRAHNLTEEKTCTLSCLAIVRYDTKTLSYVMSTRNAYRRMMRIPLAECNILTTNLAECVCVCAKCDPFLPLRFHFFFKLPEFFFRIAKFPYAAFGPLFAFHCPIFFLRKTIL